ncbi:MAG: hypothetical protein JXM79_10515 [Sedimentisphaerales bacterium]|nr:hypothetical protein [Sedimentisphaerales bacterium]
MEMKKITLILFMLLLLSSCGQYKVGDDYLTLDEALEQANNSNDLHSLREQVSSCAPLGKDQEHYEKIDMKEEEHYQEQKRKQNEEELKKTFSVNDFKHEFELEFNLQYERAHESLKSEVNEFIKNNRGSLKSKTTMEVKKLVADWKTFVDKLAYLRDEAQDNAFSHAKEYANRNNINYSWLYDTDPIWDRRKSEELSRILDTKLDEKKELLSLQNFHQVFGEPQRTQYLSLGNIYCFYWTCEDGIVQITVSGSSLDDGTVVIEELNIL